MKTFVGTLLFLTCLMTNALAQISDDVVRIGIITDLTGPYISGAGPGQEAAVRLAIEDAGGAINGKKIEVLVFDHQNKADLASNKAREWFDTQKLDVLFGGGVSAAGLAMARLSAERHKPFITSASGTARFTNEDCTPFTVHYAYDTTALAKVGGSAIVKDGGKRWYFLALDTAFGEATVHDMSDVINVNGGEILGVAKHPASISDFSSFLLQAQASGADILGLANAGADTVNAIKGAREFGLTKTMRIADSLLFIADVHALGLPLAQGIYLTENWYWDQSPESRVWAKRYFEKMKQIPSGTHAADYSAARHYLEAVKNTGTDDGDKVIAAMKTAPINDMYTKNGYIRPDGRMVHEMYLMQVKTPEESKFPWDYYKVIAKVPGEEAFTSKNESRCSLWK